jgi:hypothetical protein
MIFGRSVLRAYIYDDISEEVSIQNFTKIFQDTSLLSDWLSHMAFSIMPSFEPLKCAIIITTWHSVCITGKLNNIKRIQGWIFSIELVTGRVYTYFTENYVIYLKEAQLFIVQNAAVCKTYNMDMIRVYNSCFNHISISSIFNKIQRKGRPK